MTHDELTSVLAKHKLWLESDPGCARANLQGANLRGANLLGADLRGADLREADLRGADLWRANLQGANLRGADLRGANLQDANLQGADLRGADLREADIDFSCFPLWCGGSNFTCDIKLVYQLLAHAATLIVTGDDADDFAEIRKAILPYAKKSHRAADLGLLQEETTTCDV